MTQPSNPDTKHITLLKTTFRENCSTTDGNTVTPQTAQCVDIDAAFGRLLTIVTIL